jgi:hypothetical protein
MDNHFFNCPPLMSDGRFITNYTGKRVIEQYIRNINNIDNIHDYKNFLQLNGNIIMNREREHQLKINSCKEQGKCVHSNKNSAVCDIYSNMDYGCFK